MPTGDGLLLRAPAGWWGAEVVAGVAAAASRFGNGVVEVTSRGSLQIRGLAEDGAGRCAAALAALGIADSPPVLADPQADGETRRIAAAIAAGWPARLAPKTSVVVDGGEVLHLDEVPADLRLRAMGAGRWLLGLSGGRWMEALDAEVAPDAALRWLERIGTGRARDLDLAGALPPPAPRPAAEPVGQPAPGVLGLAAPFGSFEAGQLAALARLAPRATFRPAPGRALLLIGVGPGEAPATRDGAASLGLVTRPDDPRRRVIACPGRPACASAGAETRPLAALLALEGRAGLLHLSGCAKGCAHPGAAEVTLVGRDGGFDLVRRGTARDPAVAHLAPAQVIQEFAT
jgi:precorrin-3B synthase